MMDTQQNSFEDNFLLALDWFSRARDDDYQPEVSDAEFDDRAESLVSAAIEIKIVRNVKVLEDVLFVIAACSPQYNARLAFEISRSSPFSFSKAMENLAKGGANHRQAHATLIENIGRVARHHMLIDVMSDDMTRDMILRNMEKIRRETA